MNIQDVDQCPPRLHRLKMRMMRYFFEVIYVPGKNLVIAVTLSRALVEEADNDLQDLVKGHVAMITATLPASDAMLQRIKTATSQDPQLAGLMDVLRSKWPDHKHDVKSALKVLWDLRHTLSDADGIVLKGTQIVVPRQLRTEMMTKAHTGYLGIVKTKARAREAMWWPGMNADLEKWVSNCRACTIHQNQQRSEPLLSSPLPGRPWERVAADLFQFRDRHYLILVDYYSRFPEVYRLFGLHSGKVIQGMKQIFSCHGIPDELHSDNGPQFVIVEFRNFSRSYGFSYTTASPHYHRGIGLVERTVQTVKNLLYKSETSGEDFHLALLGRVVRQPAWLRDCCT